MQFLKLSCMKGDRSHTQQDGCSVRPRHDVLGVVLLRRQKGDSVICAGQMTEKWDLLSTYKVYTCANEYFWRWMVLTAPGQYQQVHATVLLKKR